MRELSTFVDKKLGFRSIFGNLKISWKKHSWEPRNLMQEAYLNKEELDGFLALLGSGLLLAALQC